MFDLKLTSSDDVALSRVAGILEGAFVPGDGSRVEQAYLLAMAHVAKQPPYNDVAKSICQELNMMFPESKVSFGYIGNVSRQLDDRSWRFFMITPGKTTLSYGDASTEKASELVSTARYALGGWVIQNHLAEGRYVDDSMVRLWICRHPRGVNLDYPFGSDLAESQILADVWEKAARDPYGPERTALACMRQSNPDGYMRARLKAERGIVFDEIDEGIRTSPSALRDIFGDSAKSIISTDFIRSLRRREASPGM